MKKRRMRRRSVVQLSAAAYHFVNYSRDIHDIASAVGVSTDVLRKWAKLKEWDFALRVFHYQGDPAFLPRPKRWAERDNPHFVEARDIYTELKAKDTPQHKLASTTAAAVGEHPDTIRYWVKRYHW